MTTSHDARPWLCAGALAVALAACGEPNEPNAIGPEAFDPAAGVERHVPEREPAPTAETGARDAEDD